MKAIRRFTVRTVLPARRRAGRPRDQPPLVAAPPAARPLRVGSTPRGGRSSGPTRPGLSAGSARRLSASPPTRLRRAGRDGQPALQRYLERGPLVPALGPRAGRGLPSAIAYFSPEYGITQALPQYSGGLGILAGDHLKAARTSASPILGVGLFYRTGYFKQSPEREGWQQKDYPVLDPNDLPMACCARRTAAARHHGPLPGGRALHAQVWQAQVGRVPLLLLDTDATATTAGRAR